MVEGGQRIISSFLTHLNADNKPVIDVLIITVAPILIGGAGIGVLSQGLSAVRSHHRNCDDLPTFCVCAGAKVETCPVQPIRLRYSHGLSRTLSAIERLDHYVPRVRSLVKLARG
jgi:hypothetical protein